MTDDNGRSRLSLGGGLDTAKVAGLLVIGSLVTLALLRKGFGGVRVAIGD